MAEGGDGDRDPISSMNQQQSSNKKDVSDLINTSDFFDSKGELQLSGISQFLSDLDSTASTTYDEVDKQPTQKPVTTTTSVQKKLDADVSNGDQSESQKSKSKGNEFSITDLVEKQSSSTSSSTSAQGGKKGKDKKSKAQPLAQLNTDNFQGFVHALPKQLQEMMSASMEATATGGPRFNPTSTSSPNFKNSATESATTTSLKAPKSHSSHYGVNSGFASRAPNFRLKSKEDEAKDPPYGDLNAAEIQNEARRLYEIDRAERESESQQQGKGYIGSKSPATPTSVVRNLFNASNPTPPNMLPSPAVLAMPRLNDGLDELMNYYMHKYKVRPMQPVPNLLPEQPTGMGTEAGGVSGVPLPPTTGSGVRVPVEIDEPLATRAKAFVCGDKPKEKESVDDIVARCLPQRQTQNKNLSPLPKSPKSRAVNLKELDQLWKDIQETKAKMDHDIQARLQQQQNANAPQLMKVSPSKEPGASSSNSKPAVTPKQPNPSRGKQQPRTRGKKHGKKKSKSKSSSTSASASSTSQPIGAAGDATKSQETLSGQCTSGGHVNPLIKAGLEQTSEFSTLLQMANLDESTLLEDLLLDDMNDLDYSELEDYQLPPPEEEQEEIVMKKSEAEGAGGANGNDEDEDDEEDGDAALSAALENVQLRDWLRSDPKHVVYYEKYCQEKYKREYCEKEIIDLQKQLLETKEQVAGLDGILQVKTKSGVKYQKLWEGLIKKWKQHEAECASKIDQLEKENTELSKTVESQVSKTKEYEEELTKSTELVEEFKERMEEMRRQFDAELMEWKCKMGFVQQDLNTIQGNLQQEKKEKEYVKKVLDECRTSVDQLENENKDKTVKLQITEHKLKTSKAQVDKLSEERLQLVAEVEKEREEKQALERRLRAEFREEMKKEGERLHIYYNDKVREILQTQSDKMTEAETEFIKSHEQEITALTKQYEEKIQEMKNHFENQTSNLKLYYKMEIAKLEKESHEKGKLIENVSRELALFLNQDPNGRHDFSSASNLFLRPGATNIHAAHAHTQRSPKPERKRNNSKESNLTASNPNNASMRQVDQSSSPPSSLRELLESSQGMKMEIASLINAYKEKHNH